MAPQPAAKKTAAKAGTQKKVSVMRTRRTPRKDKLLTLCVYIDNGVVYEYDLPLHKVREHSAAIVKDGYRHNNGVDEYEHYGPHRVLKVKVAGLVPTKYPDRQSGT